MDLLIQLYSVIISYSLFIFGGYFQLLFTIYQHLMENDGKSITHRIYGAGMLTLGVY